MLCDFANWIALMMNPAAFTIFSELLAFSSTNYQAVHAKTKARPLLSFCVFFAFSAPAYAFEINAQAVNVAPLPTLPAEVSLERSKEPDAAIIRLQVLLDRQGVSPGVIDGYDGNNLRKAIAAIGALRADSANGMPDPKAFENLDDQVPVIQAYTITDEDGQGLVDSIPDDYAEQARMQQLGYTSVAEKLSERFHMAIDLLKALNPTASFQPGETIAVAAPGMPKNGDVAKIVAHRKLGQISGFAKDGTLVAVYPATIGSKENPSPTGLHKVKGVARNPPYTYNPGINFQQGNNKKKLTLPSGPNGPVGTVWIDLTEPTYGLHGTPNPNLIDKVGSHGCVRLTNWDAEELAGMIKPGVSVEFVD